MKLLELQNIMDDNGIFCFEVENSINFVRDLLEFQADETERNEPYAVNSINRMRDAAREVGDLLNYVEECEEDEDED